VNVVLLHAFPLDERMWEPQLPVLGDHQVTAPRLYGRGATMDAWADSVAGEFRGDAVLVGASMGGYCALALARREPERVRAALLCGSRPDADSAERRAGRADTIRLIRSDGAEGLWRSMRPKLFADEGKADVGLLFRDADGLMGAVEAIRDRADSTDVAQRLDGRLQFVLGESDQFVSVAELDGFDVRAIAGAGHLVNVEQPEAFNFALQEFLDRV
jgi:pimeloyl-ACP methyl ester carboxylesterase